MGVSMGSQILNQTLFNILINSECVDLTELCIAKGKLAWVLYCDLVCLDDDGALLDVATVAIMSALKSLQLPEILYDTDTKVINVNEKVKHPISLKSLPVTSTFVMFEQKYLLTDPTADEENIAETTVSITTCDGKLSYVQQSGGDSLEPKRFDALFKYAAKREKYVAQLVKSIFK